ncbi:thioredoxin-like protein [Martensiomyces pterosporus]|nr:thioredoxin-like protein [Martensiomyces pterosporus]
MKLATLAVAFLSVVSGYDILDTANFDAKTKDGIWLVKFYSPTCPWSRRFAPTWTKVYEDLQDGLSVKDVFFGEVDCKANRALCDSVDIDGYPTVVHFDQGANKGEVPGGQSYESLTQFAKSL